ncbi:MAG: low temperature requirement protein A [Actinomycetota bacterium]|nr:low temperature requirement protein A [Actinomycetota bacterium]
MPLHVRMSARDPDEAHRAATPLELFLDLTFVVAIAQAASSLHHGLVEGDAGGALIGFPLVFFAIWWAWMNFTWFASAYDTDDAFYRLAVFVQMAGVLIVAAGIPRAFDGQNFAVITAGYVVMRLALVGQWLRAAASHPEGRSCALRYAAGVAVLQVGWIARLALPDSLFLPGFLVLAAAELAVPPWAEASGGTSWHPGHIAERYGLFTIIVLGESVLAATVGVQVALDGDSTFGDLASVVVGGLLIVFSMWWLYFDMPAGQVVERARRAFVDRLTGAFAWGYGHYVVFTAAAAAGAGLAVAVDQATGHSALSDVEAGFALTVPVTVYLLAVWGLHFRQKPPSVHRTYAVPFTVVLILGGSATPEPVLATGAVLAAVIALSVVFYRPQAVSVEPWSST